MKCVRVLREIERHFLIAPFFPENLNGMCAKERETETERQTETERKHSFVGIGL